MLTTPLSIALIGMLLSAPPTFAFAQEIAVEGTGTRSTEWLIPLEDVAPALEMEPVGMPTSSLPILDEAADSATSSSMETTGPANEPPEELAMTTSTSPDPFEMSATTTTTTVESLIPILSAPPPPGEFEAFASSTAPTSSMLCLAIIAPSPADGPEWIAVHGLTPSTSVSFIGWSFADAQSSLVKVNASTTLIWDEASQTMRYELRSARLNNGGDSVFLKTPEETVHDAFTYPETDRGQWWARDGCLGAWERLPRPIVVTPPPSTESAITPAPIVPSGPLILNEPLPELDPSSAPVLESAPVTQGQGQAAVQVEQIHPEPFMQPPPARISEAPMIPDTEKTSAIKSVKKTTATNAAAKAVTKAKTTKKMATSTKATVKKTAAKPPKKAAAARKKAPAKTTAASKTPPLLLLMPPLLERPDEFQGVRVRLRGRVASQTNFLGAHTFVVLNEDGRGLLVKGTSKHPSPALGTWIDLMGTVVWNDTGLSVKQAAADTWEPYALGSTSSSDPFPTRTVDLFAPAQEEAWSLVRVEGRVSAVQKSSFDLDVGDVSLRVRLASRLGYRAQRLQVGDTVVVQGLLDLRPEEPTLLPQTIESIEIVKRAVPPAPAAKAPVEQPWLPVGAAAGTLALSEGWRRFNAYRKQRQEAASFRKLLETSGKDRA